MGVASVMGVALTMGGDYNFMIINLREKMLSHTLGYKERWVWSVGRSGRPRDSLRLVMVE